MSEEKNNPEEAPKGPEIISRLSEQDIRLISPELQELERLDSNMRMIQDRLARMLMLREPSYLRDPEVQFDMRRMAFYRVPQTNEG